MKLSWFFDEILPYGRALFGPTLAFLVAWIFINVHHVFIDAVIWRSGNPELRRCFSA